ncbi:MAG: hypothetical protein JWL98_2054, partial [Xanthomonadaceae bacterium]|nr:hypothetical protein [Xanthomonadaceae bacterium]
TFFLLVYKLANSTVVPELNVLVRPCGGYEQSGADGETDEGDDEAE